MIASPEVTLTNALNQAVDHVQPTQSAVGFSGVSGVKNIVAVTACPTGVAHTFMSAEAIETYAKNKVGRSKSKRVAKWAQVMKLRLKKSLRQI